MRADALDEWFSGGWWRLVSRPDKPFSALLHKDMEVNISLLSESVYVDSHHECAQCTWGVALGLDNTSKDTLSTSAGNDPRIALAFLPLGIFGPEPDEVCNSLAGSCGFSMSLQFETFRDVQQTRKIYRSMLADFLHDRLNTTPE